MVVEPAVKPRSAPAHAAPNASASRTVALSTLLDAWVAQQLITPTQARRLRDADVRVSLDGPARPRTTGGSVAVEAVGYLGGVLVLAAAFSLTSLYWGELQSWQRLL